MEQSRARVISGQPSVRSCTAEQGASQQKFSFLTVPSVTLAGCRFDPHQGAMLERFLASSSLGPDLKSSSHPENYCHHELAQYMCLVFVTDRCCAERKNLMDLYIIPLDWEALFRSAHLLLFLRHVK